METWEKVLFVLILIGIALGMVALVLAVVMDFVYKTRLLEMWA